MNVLILSQSNFTTMSTEERFVLYGGPDAPSIDPDARSLGETLLKKFAEHGEKNMFVSQLTLTILIYFYPRANIEYCLLLSQIDGVTGRKLAASDLRSRIIQCARSLQSNLGVKEGDIVGLFSENRLEFPIIVFAAFCLGATVAPLNVTYTTRELQHALDLSQPKVLFVTKLVQRRALQVLPKIHSVQHTVCLDDVQPNGKFISYAALVQHVSVSISAMFVHLGS